MLSPLPFEHPEALLDQVGRSTPVPVAVAGADAEVALESAKRANDAGLILPFLVGDQGRIRKLADSLGWTLGETPVIHAESEGDAVGQAVALARQGEVAALKKGQVHTDSLMRAVVSRDHGLRTASRISHVFHMTAPDREGSLLITDAAVNVAPDVETKLHLIANALMLCRALGRDAPRVAVLSATESASAAMPSSLEAAEVAKRAADRFPTAFFHGPLALDGAVSPEAAKIKGLTGPVAGQADLLLVPNIETGNAVFKAMVYFMSATAAGLVLGARVPIVLTSRADPPEARLAATALAALVAAAAERQEI